MKRQRNPPKGKPPKRIKRQGSFASQAVVSKAVVAERKYFTASRNGLALVDLTTNDDWTGTEADISSNNCLFSPSRGDDITDRDGRKVQVLAIKIRGFVECAEQTNQTVADQSALCRIVLVQDKQTNAAQLNGEDVLGGTTNTRAINSFQNPGFFGRFKVLKDIQVLLESPTMSFDGTNIEQSGIRRHFKITHKFAKPMVVHFNSGNAGTVADIVDNSFHIIAGFDAGNLAPSLSYTVRTTFVDV